MKKGAVEPVPGEPGRYYVDSFESSHDSREKYLVDLNLDSFGCTCADWDYRRRPECERLLAIGKIPPGELACKHIAKAREYRRKWEFRNENAASMIGGIALFESEERWLLGEIVACSPTPPNGPEPDFFLTMRGRSGREKDIEYLANKVFIVDSWEEGDAYLEHLN